MKVIEGHGTTIDVVLVNGVLHEGDQIVVCGMQVKTTVHFVSVQTYSMRAISTCCLLIAGAYCYDHSSSVDSPSNEGT